MNAAALKSLTGGMWQEWQKRVEAALPNFAASPLYVEQDRQPEEEFRRVAEQVKRWGPIDEDGRTRDAQFGGRLVETCLGPVTRMWLDSNVEVHFLYRHLPDLARKRVLDIGAGYGRLAVALEDHVTAIACVDAVPVSKRVCREYCEKFAHSIFVIGVDEITPVHEALKFSLAVNIHSWNECTLEQVENWLAVLVKMQVPHLFTVAHGQMDKTTENAYYTHQTGFPSFRPSIERYYDLVAEECIGMETPPHALWKLKEGAVPVPYVPPAAPAKPLVWIATPMKHLAASGAITKEVFESFDAHWKDPIKEIQARANAGALPFNVEVCVAGGGGVARARNRIVTDFLASSATYLFFQDYDLKPSAEDFARIISRMMQHGFLVCGGFYTTREENGHWVYNYPDAAGIRECWALRVGELGTGFKCYHRSAFEHIGAKNPWLLCQNDDTRLPEWGFFSMGPVKDALWPGIYRWLTEDYWLDWLTRDAGIPIVVDTTIQLRHWDDATQTVCPKVFPPLPQPAPTGAVLVGLGPLENEASVKATIYLEERAKLDSAQVGGHVSL